MDIHNFIQKFSLQFEETESGDITEQTIFQDLEEWSSLLLISTIAMIDDEYGVMIKGDEVRNSRTVEDLFQVVVSKKK